MKNILILFLLFPAFFSCNKNEESTPAQACPALYEFDKIVINFELKGNSPVEPAIYVNDKIVLECMAGGQEICIYGMTLQNGKLMYRMETRRDVPQDMSVDLYDNSTLRISRTDEIVVRTRTRPNDSCGSGYVNTLTIRE